MHSYQSIFDFNIFTIFCFFDFFLLCFGRLVQFLKELRKHLIYFYSIHVCRLVHYTHCVLSVQGRELTLEIKNQVVGRGEQD